MYESRDGVDLHERTKASRRNNRLGDGFGLYGWKCFEKLSFAHVVASDVAHPYLDGGAISS
jgi:hypothetical protein